MPGEPLISFQGVSKRFDVGRRRRGPVVEALRSVTFEVNPGESVGVVGPNGAGKSTLFSILLGFTRASSGTVRIEQVPPRDYVRARGAGYLPERFQLPPEWRVSDALAALARLDGGPDPGPRAASLIDKFGLGEHADKRIGELSRGLLQRLGLAQALLAGSNLIVLDEPTEGLDPIWRIRLREIIAELRSAGRTILLASHELAEVELAVERVIVLEGGTIREILQTAHDEPARRYRILLQQPHASVSLAFPGVTTDGRIYLVTADSPADLSARLAALLAGGALIEAVTPADGLEQRVRDALSPGAGA